MFEPRSEEKEELKELEMELNAQNCYDKNWVLSLNKQHHLHDFACFICEHVANNAMELNCPQHKNNEEGMIVGNHCLQQYLKNNNHHCPSQQHRGCQYSENKVVQQQIERLS